LQLDDETKTIINDISIHFDRTRFSLVGNLSDLKSREIGNWNTKSKSASDIPISSSKIGEVIAEYNSNRLIVRIFTDQNY
jgi:hypothetical protein